MTEEQGKINGVHSESVYEIVPMRDTDERHGCFAENQSVNSTSKVLGSNRDVGEFVEQRMVIDVETLQHQQNILPGTRKKLIYI